MSRKLTLTDWLRVLVREEAKECPTCGHLNRSAREMSKTLGVPVASLWRFMSGKAPSAALLDKLFARYESKIKGRA